MANSAIEVPILYGSGFYSYFLTDSKVVKVYLNSVNKKLIVFPLHSGQVSIVL